jgi:hypothetical protein
MVDGWFRGVGDGEGDKTKSGRESSGHGCGGGGEGGGGRGTMLAVVELRRNPISLQRGEGAGR